MATIELVQKNSILRLNWKKHFILNIVKFIRIKEIEKLQCYDLKMTNSNFKTGAIFGVT